MVNDSPCPNFKEQRPRTYIREWRHYRNLTQEQLADRINVATSTISQLETGKQGYSDETIAALAWALDCEPGDLLSRDPNAPDYNLWRIIRGMSPDKQEQALRLMRALEGDQAA